MLSTVGAGSTRIPVLPYPGKYAFAHWALAPGFPSLGHAGVFAADLSGPFHVIIEPLLLLGFDVVCEVCAWA